MKYTVLILFFFTAFCRNASAQSHHDWLDTFDLRPHFHVGDVRTYDVDEMDKAEAMFSGSRADVKYRVRFQVVDTMRNGWLMQYSVRTISAKDRNLSALSLIGKLSDGLKLTFYMGAGNWQLDSAQYVKEKTRISNAYDSAMDATGYDPKNYYSARKFQIKLHQPDGLENFIGPLISFANMYQLGIFKKYKRREDGCISNLFNQCLVKGEFSNEWVSTSEKEGTVKLVTFFTADEYSAAKYYGLMIRAALEAEDRHIERFTIPTQIRSTLEHNYTVESSTCFPVYLFEKSVIEWGVRTVSKQEMRLTDDAF